MKFSHNFIKVTSLIHFFNPLNILFIFSLMSHVILTTFNVLNKEIFYITHHKNFFKFRRLSNESRRKVFGWYFWSSKDAIGSVVVESIEHSVDALRLCIMSHLTETPTETITSHSLNNKLKSYFLISSQQCSRRESTSSQFEYN